MANVLTLPDMYRDTYRSELQEELQQKTAKFNPFVTWLPGATGKRIEFNSMGTVEADFRQHRFEDKDPKEIGYDKRCMLPVGIALAVKYSEDDKILKGDFSVAAGDFTRQMSHALERKQDSLILGTVFDTVKKRWTKAKAQTSIDPRTSFYQGAAIGGIVGPAYVGEFLNVPEELPDMPYLTTNDALAEDISEFDGNNLDWEKTLVIPSSYTGEGTTVESSLTVPKLMALRLAMESRDDDFGDGDILNLAITPAMKWALVNDPEFKNRDYGFTTLKDGLMSTFLGIRFLVSNKVPVVDVGDKEVYSLPAWRTQDIYAAWWDNLSYDIVKPDMSYDKIVISANGALGCARNRANTVISVHCAK